MSGGKRKHGEFERITRVRLPFDRRAPEPARNYGVHELDIWFILKGLKGAVQYGFTVHAHLPHVEREFAAKQYDSRGSRSFGAFSGFDVGYHAPSPQYDDQPSMPCEVLGEGKCYYAGSSLRASDWTEHIFSTIGRPPEEVIWEKLEAYYRDRFEVGT